ncbi:MAG: phospholipid carrier-dependent glycosyltransferase [Haliscomenobacteraceae bacterium CHB4]|nr:phospholipid carrier-dependent glycosyltransferase [Haliscomenobacteraceae bacterium CHB4]
MMTFRYTCGYVLLFSLTAFINRYDVWLSLPPASIHQWRQADGAAIAWHYAQQPYFWEPKVCNLFGAGDAHAAGEFPLLYWVAGLIGHYADWPEYPLRWIGLLMLFLGCRAFGWIILQLTQRPLMAVLGCGLLLTSPVLVYYGPGFLPDAPAFCCVLMMMACLFQADQRQSARWLCAAALCAALAILLKMSMAIVPVALAITWFQGKWRRQWPSGSLWNGRWPLLAVAGVAVVVLGFRWWIAWYNELHHATYFLASTRPVWRYDWPFIRETIMMFGRMGLPAYASAGLYLACLGGLWLGIKHWKTAPFAVRNVLVFTALGSIAYFLLWFRMFREHDYYTICLLAIPVLLLLNGFRLALQRWGEKRIVWALGLCWLLGIGHAQYIMSKRMHQAFHPETSLNLPPGAFLSPERLTDAGIPVSARVLCPQDPSPNIALFALKRHGWTACNFGDRINVDTLHKYRTDFGLTHLALRDTALYSPLYRRFFPARVFGSEGWYLYTYPVVR